VAMKLLVTVMVLCPGALLRADEPEGDGSPPRFDIAEQVEAYRSGPHAFDEPLRPQFHFTPPINWMNDPNGLVFHDGEYHLFYQYNPAGNEWGHMSWGHAVSPDLVHWQHLPLAIPETDTEMAFSGCCVVDHANTSGLGSDGQAPMVAIYTGHAPGRQVQNIAFSLDRGRSWKPYAGNPVLDEGLADFRDPKVFWHEPTQRWVMVVSRAIERVLVLYGSHNLTEWTELSRFGPAGALNKPNWECPDLFELPLLDEQGKAIAGESRWVLEVDIGGGAIAGGSGSEYFVGHFDGEQFQAEQAARWVDYGRDFYAPVSWDNIPADDGRRIWIGWMNNWETSLVPTSPWRGAMTVPRSLALKRVAFNTEEPAVITLIQQPVEELRLLELWSRTLEPASGWPPAALTRPGELDDMTFVLEVEIEPADARSAGVRIRTGDDEYTEIGFDRFDAAVYVDRTKSGNVGFHPAFPGRHRAPARLIDGSVRLRILVDRSSVEVFVNDGEAVITDRIFPTRREPVIEGFAGSEEAEVRATLVRLAGIYRVEPRLPE
jgi:fructan beta-fructosidase